MHNIASIEVEQDIIQANDKLASENRKKFGILQKNCLTSALFGGIL